MSVNQPAADDRKAGDCDALVITCEHGGHEVPPAYAPLFASHEEMLLTHRGWDAGALELARQMAQTLNVPLFASTTTRLLIDLNRSIGHRQLYSEATRDLSRATKRAIIAVHYLPHREAVESCVAGLIAAGRRVVHVASHSFTPEMNGVVRQADVAWLYDPRRGGEGVFARRWSQALKQRRPDLQLRRNYPYQGKCDGLMSLLRKRHAPAQYVGIELEVNQRFAIESGAVWDAVRSDIIQALVDVS